MPKRKTRDEDDEQDTEEEQEEEVGKEVSDKFDDAGKYADGIVEEDEANKADDGEVEIEAAVGLKDDSLVAATEMAMEHALEGATGGGARLAHGGDPEWYSWLYQLIYYKAIHGDFRARNKDEDFKPLFDWMVMQRKEFKAFSENPANSLLTVDQIKVLDSLQFPWNTRGDEHWFKNYDHLRQFQAEHGHTMVPRTFQEVPNLCHWVTDQRRQLKNLKQAKPTTMTKDRQRMLNNIGFVWQVRNRTTWDKRFAELVTFKETKGSTVVPQHYATNKALGKWVAKQREQYKLLQKGQHSFLTPDRLEQLNSIDFVWSMKGRSPSDVIMKSSDAVIEAAKSAVAAAVARHDEVDAAVVKDELEVAGEDEDGGIVAAVEAVAAAMGNEDGVGASV